MPGEPSLSVIMPVHEGAEWIEATLESLVAQPAGSFEIIAIDSSVSPATSEIVQRFSDRLPIRLLRRLDLLPWQVKTNVGVRLASAEHVCILHQDDLWLPVRGEVIRSWISARPLAALHLAPTLVIDRKGRALGTWKCPLPAETELHGHFVLNRLLVQNFVAVPSVIFRRDAWLQSGGMDEKLWYTPDWDMWTKLSRAGTVVYHEELTSAFRVHGTSQTITGSHDADDFRSQMEIVLERYLDCIPAKNRRAVERAARTSINMNVSLAAASGGRIGSLFSAAAQMVLLGPAGMVRYLRDSRLMERVMPRLRAKAWGAF